MNTAAEPVRRVRARRSDARDNETRILDAAREAFSASPEAGMNAIAKAAGVGQATLYRNFSNRESLLVAVYRADVEALIAAADELVGNDDPVGALREWFARLAAYGRIKHGASRAVEAATTVALGSEYYPPVIAALDALLDAGRRSGRLRDDVSADDVLLLLSFLWRAEPSEDWQRRSSVMLDVVLDGLATRP